jgi:hypothetical protein
MCYDFYAFVALEKPFDPWQSSQLLFRSRHYKVRTQLRQGGFFSVIGKFGLLSTERMRVRILLQAVLTLQDGIHLATAPGSWERSACIAIRRLVR